MGQYKKGRGYVYNIEYHIIFVTKYRKSVLTPQIQQELYKTLKTIAKKHNYNIKEVNGDTQHVHILLQATPQHSIPTIIKQLKGESARHLFKKYPQLKQSLWKGHLWSPSYFISTTSQITTNTIQQYIQSQPKNPRSPGRPKTR